MKVSLENLERDIKAKAQAFDEKQKKLLHEYHQQKAQVMEK